MTLVLVVICMLFHLECKGYSSPTHKHSGLQILTQVIITDITTLKWRGLVSALTSTPFIINGFISANVSTQVLEHTGWQWGCTYICLTPSLV